MDTVHGASRAPRHRWFVLWMCGLSQGVSRVCKCDQPSQFEGAKNATMTGSVMYDITYSMLLGRLESVGPRFFILQCRWLS